MRNLVLVLALSAAPALAAEDPHAGHQMPAPAAPVDPHAGHTMPAPELTGTEPSPPSDFAADKIFGAAAMADARHMLRHEHGGHSFSKVMIEELEYFGAKGADGYRWDAEAWVGGDINRAVLKTEGEGNRRLESAEVQALYSRAIGPYFDLQAGVRHDIKPNPSRTYAVVGLEGLAPYWFEVDAQAFLSDKGDLFARVVGSYDQLITQRLVAQPRAEVNLSAQDGRDVGAGLSDLDIGLRLRYEIRREFAPYIGVSYERKLGQTADLARAAGESIGGARVLLGLRAWF